MTGIDSSADLCRANGWGPGTRLIGTQRPTPTSSHRKPITTEIEVTAVGERRILAKVLSRNGRPVALGEQDFYLLHAEWKEAS